VLASPDHVPPNTDPRHTRLAPGRSAGAGPCRSPGPFEERTAALASQYDEYEPLPGLHVNGQLTLGENIADVAGVHLARKAYALSLGGKEAPILDGYTGAQRFYLAFAQYWRTKQTDGSLRQRVLSNPHSPAAYRVNGVVRNDDEWYAAFSQVKPGDRYYLPPERRIRLW
jgi:putative endopeptidase